MAMMTTGSAGGLRKASIPRLSSGVCHVSTVLCQSPYLELRRIHCELREGMAILHGKVSNFYLKQLAQELVKKVDDVELVVNRVDVAYSK
jgi:hypothetical protein